jgi:hypothetical protein
MTGRRVNFNQFREALIGLVEVTQDFFLLLGEERSPLFKQRPGLHTDTI